MHKEYAQTADQVLSDLQSGPEGLSAAQADGRLAEYGPNRLREAPKATLLQRFLQQLRDPMLLILMAAAAVSAVTNYLSHEPFTEVLIILAVVLLNAALGVIQESKAEAAIEALQTMTAATSKVLRDGAVAELESSRLVPGDVVLLEAGDAVPADGRLLACASLQIEEAALTGESVPSAKSTDPLTGDVPLGDRRNMAYMGSTVSYGRGRMVVTATGMETEMGKIAGVLARTEQEETPLQKKLTQLGKTSGLVIATGGGCVTQPRNYPMLHQNGVIFWLKRDISKLPTDGRPLSQANPLDAMFAKRAPMYAAFADHAVSNDGTAEETVAAILSIMEEPI